MIEALDGSLTLRILGGILMIFGWIMYHFFNVVFDESIKFVVLGIALIVFSFIVKEMQKKVEVEL